MIRIDVLDVPGADYANAGREVEGVMLDADVTGRSRQRTAVVGAKNGVLGKQRLENGRDVFLVRQRKNEVGRVASAIPDHQHRHLLGGQPALAGPAAPLARWAFSPFRWPLCERRK